MADYLTSIEAAKYIHLPLSTLLLYIREGKIRAIRVGKRYLLIKEEIDRDLKLIDNRN